VDLAVARRVEHDAQELDLGVRVDDEQRGVTE
jgi:hypothetical protein